MSSDITITRVPSDPPHFRASDGAWSLDGLDWYDSEGDMIDGDHHRVAFHAQILATTTPEQPEWARVGQHFLSELTGKPCRIREVDAWGVYAVDDEGTAVDCRHGHYTIVSQPTATGDKITERDGVWEDSTGIVRVLVVGGSTVSTIAKDGLWFPPSDVQPHHTYTRISTNPADILGVKGGE